MGEAVYGSTAAEAGAPGGAMVVQERLRISGKVVRSLGRLPAAQDKSKELTLPMQMTPFDTFTDTNPFTMKTLDA